MQWGKDLEPQIIAVDDRYTRDDREVDRVREEKSSSDEELTEETTSNVVEGSEDDFLPKKPVRPKKDSKKVVYGIFARPLVRQKVKTAIVPPVPVESPEKRSQQRA